MAENEISWKDFLLIVGGDDDVEYAVECCEICNDNNRSLNRRINSYINLYNFTVLDVVWIPDYQSYMVVDYKGTQYKVVFNNKH